MRSVSDEALDQFLSDAIAKLSADELEEVVREHGQTIRKAYAGTDSNDFDPEGVAQAPCGRRARRRLMAIIARGCRSAVRLSIGMR